MPFIDHRSVIPLYYQLAQILREQIRTTELPAGQLLPSERELMNTYDLSRNTVRQALDLLAREGLIVREHGHGTYVSNLSNSFHYMMDTFYENRDLLKRAGYTPTVKQISSQRLIPPEVVRQALRLEPQVETLCHTMIFFADDRPAMYTQDFLPLALAGEYDLSLEGEGFMRYLDRASGVRVEYVLVDISPVEAAGEVAHAFSCPVGKPLLLMKETFLDGAQNRAVCFSLNYFNQEVLNFRLLTRRG
ncbi:MAG: GntR family transcriptional regulator [Anaerolineae bacterium]|nr:GntR family transcriptional regulator [Anaerolineae bacterium]